MGRMIFMRGLLVCCEMMSWAWRCGHAIHTGVIVRWTGWDDEQDAGQQRRFRRGFYQRVSERFSSCAIISRPELCRAENRHEAVPWHYGPRDSA